LRGNTIFGYSLYGLRLSSNHPIPGLISLDDSMNVHTAVLWGALPRGLDLFRESEWVLRYSSPVQEASGLPNLSVWDVGSGGYSRFSYGDGTNFVVGRDARQVWAIWPETLTLEDAATYLVGPVIGFVLRQRGTLCLHASAIAVGDQAIALVGGPGAGKSTTAAAFASLGYGVLSDDIVALADEGTGFVAQPGYPRLCLWPDSARALPGRPRELPRLTPNWEKQFLDLDAAPYRFERSPLPLGAIYLLSERSAQPGAPEVEGTSPRAALMELVSNTYMNYLLDREQRAREFEALGRLVGAISVRRVHPHEDPVFLTKLCEAIVADFESSAGVCSASAREQDDDV
jgi:hypothetical protein